MNQRASRSFGGIGIASVILIFIMLCMVTFAVLSLMTARSDLNQSRQNADRTTAYYQAENEAEDILTSILQCIEETLDAPDAASFYHSLREQLEGTQGIRFSDDSRLTYCVPCGQDQQLQVTLELSYEEQEDGRHYKILGWNTQVTHEWEADTSLPLYEPD